MKKSASQMCPSPISSMLSRRKRSWTEICFRKTSEYGQGKKKRCDQSR